MITYIALAVLLAFVIIEFFIIHRNHTYKYAGNIVVDRLGEKITISLELDQDPIDLIEAKKVYFEVKYTEDFAQ